MPERPKSKLDVSADVFFEGLAAGRHMPFRALGHSMRPFLPSGTLVTIKASTPADVIPGDIVLMCDDDSLVLHRYLKMSRENQQWLITKGDWLNESDAPWPPESLIGVLSAVWRNGREVPIAQGVGAKLIRRSAALFSPVAGLLLAKVRSIRGRLGRNV